MLVDVFFKVELDLDSSENPQRVAIELERLLKRYYGVRNVETTNMVTHESAG